MALFRAATTITIGNEETASFWHDNWTARGPLCTWAPDLYKIASRKNRCIAKELKDANWIRSIARLSKPVHLAQYLQFWNVVAATHLLPD
jgi:hypothetical protein